MMERVYLCGRKNNTAFALCLKRVLENYGKVWYKGICSGKGEKEFVLEEGENWPAPQEEQGVLLLQNRSPVLQGVPPVKGWTAVLCADNQAGLYALKGTGIPVITCGSGKRNSISLSSWDFPQGSVSLLRDLTTLPGTLLEPGEIPVIMENVCSRAWMPVICAVLLLCNVPVSEGYRI